MKKVSVIMPVYNGDAYLKEAIESILNQSFKDFEFIIINDGSTDNSLDIINSYDDDRIIIVDQKNQGLVKSLNSGIRKSKYELIARMDADDISEKDRFREQITFMDNYPDAALVGTQAQVISEDGKFLYYSKLPIVPKDISEYLMRTSPFFHGSVMIRKAILNKIGGYDENVIHFVEDLILWKRINLTYDMYNLNMLLYKYRLRYNALSNRPKSIEKKMIQLCDFITHENNLEKKGQYYKEINRLLKKLKKISKERLLSNYHLTLGRIYLTRNIQLEEARYNLACAFRYFPLNMKVYYYLVLYLFHKTKLNA